MTRKCAWCKEDFEPTDPKQIYCDSNCRQRMWRYINRNSKPRTVACEECGTEFVTKRTDKKFCSTKCRHRNYKKRIGKGSKYEKARRKKLYEERRNEIPKWTGRKCTAKGCGKPLPQGYWRLCPDCWRKRQESADEYADYTGHEVCA